MGRDGLSFDEACEVLTVTEGVAVSRPCCIDVVGEERESAERHRQ